MQILKHEPSPIPLISGKHENVYLTNYKVTENAYQSRSSDQSKCGR